MRQEAFDYIERQQKWASKEHETIVVKDLFDVTGDLERKIENNRASMRKDREKSTESKRQESVGQMSVVKPNKNFLSAIQTERSIPEPKVEDLSLVPEEQKITERSTIEKPPIPRAPTSLSGQASPRVAVADMEFDGQSREATATSQVKSSAPQALARKSSRVGFSGSLEDVSAILKAPESQYSASNFGAHFSKVGSPLALGSAMSGYSSKSTLSKEPSSMLRREPLKFEIHIDEHHGS